MDCYLHEGMKVLYRVAMAILVLFHRQSNGSNSVLAKEIQDNGIDSALAKFCKNIPVSINALM